MTRYLVFAILASIAAGCSGAAANSPTSPTTYVTGTAPFSELDLAIGNGPEVGAGQQVIVGYTVWLYSATDPGNQGPQVGSSYTSGVPYAFVVGAGTVIHGLDQGVVGMHVGGSRLLVIPPDLAYGAAGTGLIPPNATLLFEVDLLSAS